MIRKYIFAGKHFNRKWLIEGVDVPRVGYSKDDILEYLGNIASTCSGIDFTRKQAIRKARDCSAEAAGRTPSKVFEYLPMFSTEHYPNLRSIIKDCGYSLERAIERYLSDDCHYVDFHVFKCRVPQFVWTHVATHRSLSPLKRSVRMGKEGKYSFWVPEYDKNKNVFKDRQSFENDFEKIPKIVFEKMAMDRYDRKEIYNRWPSEFRLVDFMICGSKRDFYNFFAERGEGTATQKETKDFAKNLEEFMQWKI